MQPFIVDRVATPMQVASYDCHHVATPVFMQNAERLAKEMWIGSEVG